MALDTRYDPKDIEPRILERWLETGVFHADEEAAIASPQDTFSVVIPPPNVTGVLHLGHALNNTLQDVLVRYHRMKGGRAMWLPGTDHAGIATQNVVEKQLRKGGQTRHDLGREAFLEQVWAWKEKNGSRIVEQLKRIGASCDWDRERFTMDEGLSGAVREVFCRLHEKGLIYRGERLVNWCPRCETALSDEEAIPNEQKGKLYQIRYPLKSDPERFVTVATTRPETMLGDTAVAVNPDDERFKDLIGQTVILPLMEREIPIVGDDYVKTDFGTGCLKVTPAHDPNDFEVGNRHGLERINVMTPDGKINERGGAYAGLDRTEARKRVLTDLEAKGLLGDVETMKHAVPRCERCDTVLEYYLSKQWFVSMQKLAEPAIAACESGELRFTPERWKNVYMHWMRNIRDWCISRQLWWGHRIPVWYCDACGADTCSRETPTACGGCGSENLRQDPDVLDTWFSSWLWPFSTLGWPEKTPALEAFYPTNVLVTGHEIIFFWVARMVMAGFEFMGQLPFKDVMIHGIVRDTKGRKMSKSLGNGIDPLEVIEETSADALRFTILFLTPEGQDTRISKQKFDQGRNFCTKLWNAARLVLTNLEGFTFRDELPALDAAEDRWVLSRLQRSLAEATDALEAQRPNVALQVLYDFTWGDFCDWWLEMAKPRLYDGAAPDARAQAQAVGAHVLHALIRMLHPFVPFVTEELWTRFREIPGADGLSEQVVTASYPVADPARIDEAAEA
ncbi:MAG: valine--tRNA ligase, partial [Planctomycetota bacterium]